MRWPAILLPLALAGCGQVVPCNERVIDVARDPGSDRYAATAVRNCGATTGFVTVVRVGRASERQDDAAEVLVADSDHGAAAPGNAGAIWLDVFWPRPGRLVIGYASRARVYRRVQEAKGAAITFRASGPLAPPPYPPPPI